MATTIRIAGAWLAAAALSACASSAFVSSWQAPDAAPLQVEGSKVAAIVMMSDLSSRRAAEDALVRELDARGARGIALYTIAPDANPDNEDAVRAALEQAGVAGSVVMRPVRTEKEIVGTATDFGGPLFGPRYGMFWGGYYGYGWRSPWSLRLGGGEIRTDTIVSVETLVYSLRQNMLVWAGQSRTTNPGNVDRLVRDTAGQVARELERRGLIPHS
jgi:hypothetical protein